MTTFEEDDLVIAEAPNVTVQRGDGGRVIERGTWEFHRVYWPRYSIVAYHNGNQLRKVGNLAGTGCDCMDCSISGEATH